MSDKKSKDALNQRIAQAISSHLEKRKLTRKTGSRLEQIRRRKTLSSESSSNIQSHIYDDIEGLELDPPPLEDWYPSEQAKRIFSRLCRCVGTDKEKIFLLGTKEKPLLVLSDAGTHPALSNDVIMSVDEVKSDWSNVTLACAVYGTRFRIVSRQIEQAVLFRHPETRHPMEKYARSSNADTNEIAKRLISLAQEVQKLTIDRSILEEMFEMLKIIHNNFKYLFREKNGYECNGLSFHC